MTKPYDLLLSKIRTFYELDNRTPIIGRSSVYLLERSPRDYEFIRELFTVEYAQHNISKIKQMSSLFDLLHHVDYEYSTKKNSELRIEIYNVSTEMYKKGLVQVSFGNVFYFSISEESESIPDDMMFASKKYLKSDTLIEHHVFEKIYAENLVELCTFIEPDMTLKLFNERDKKTVDQIRIDNLKNTGLTYSSKAERSLFFYNFSTEPKDFFIPLKRVFSDHLLRQVKSIEALLRFEADLKYGKPVYELIFNYSLSEHKFRMPTNLYAIVFTYDYEFDLSITLYFSFKNNDIRYLEIDLDTQETLDITGYEAIYEHIRNRIKMLLTSNLGINSEELTNQSVLLYKMVSI